MRKDNPESRDGYLISLQIDVDKKVIENNLPARLHNALMVMGNAERTLRQIAFFNIY